jgi:16S rRNA (cytidine1402-2'-O)-methyltransferase
VPPADNRPGTLWIVATPIGTLGDLAPRAREILRDVDLILAEDTRRARALLSHLELPAAGRVQCLHEHNENRKVEAITTILKDGGSTALISDAGTPVLSDPGFVLVRAVRAAGLPVRSVPGPSSFTAALAASGQPPLPVTLCGFLPGRSGARRRRIEELSQCPWTLVILLSPHRLGRELADLAEVLGEEREATLLAEISKRFERAEVATLGELVASKEVDGPRGEYILVVGPPSPRQPDGTNPTHTALREAYVEAVNRGLGRGEAMRETARRFGLRRREVFAALHEADED